MTVAELIEFLRRYDDNMSIETRDCYGSFHDFYIFDIEEYEYSDNYRVLRFY